MGSKTAVINQRAADFVPRELVDAVLAVGGTPIGLPYLPSQRVASLLPSLDGIILTGGPDLDPALMNEEPIPELGRTYRPRDDFELALVRLAAAQGIPILGICRGTQLLNVALGGTVYQDLPTQYPGRLIQHQQLTSGNLPVHHVSVQPSALQRAVGPHPFVNSRHHQAIKVPAHGLKVVAKAADGVIEALESADAKIQGVQWHPENLWQTDPSQLAYFQAFMKRL